MFKFRIIYGKYGLLRFIGHLDTVNTVFLAMRRAEFPLSYTKGFNPRIKASFSPPLPIGFSSDVEFMEVFMESRAATDKLSGGLQSQLPGFMEVKSVEEVGLSEKPLSGRIEAVVYELKTAAEMDERIVKEMEKFSLDNAISGLELKDGNTAWFEVAYGGGTPAREIAEKLSVLACEDRCPVEFTRKKFIFKV